MIDTYIALLIIYLVLRFLGGRTSPFAVCLGSCLPAVLLPAFLVFPMSIGQLDRVALAGSGLAILLFASAFGPRFMPRISSTIAEPRSSLRVLSHNTGQDMADYAVVYDQIRRSQADIVVLQEITKDCIERFWPGLLELYPYQTHGPFQGTNQATMGILSRYPLTDGSSFKLAERGLVFQQRVLVSIAGEYLAVYNTHLTFPWIRTRPHPVFSALPVPFYDNEVLQEEMPTLVGLLQGELVPVVAAGDFNFTDQSTEYRQLTRLVTDAYTEAGWGLGFTWPANLLPVLGIRPSIPVVRVDYVFHSDEMAALRARLMGAAGSDHRAIVVDLALSQQ